MIIRAVLRHETTRWFPIWIGMLLVNAGLFLSLMLGAAASRQSTVPGSLVVLIGWSSIAVFLGFGPVRGRCRILDLALPVSARRLWIIHLSSIVLAAGGFAAAYSVCVGLFSRIGAGRTRLGADASAVAILLGSGVLLAVFLLESFRPSLARVPVARGYVAWSAVVLAGVGAMLSVVAERSLAWAWLPVLAAATLAARLYGKIPGAYELVPAEPTEARFAAGSAAAAAWRDEHGARHRVLARTLLRLSSLGPKDLLGYAFIVAIAVTLGGCFAAVTGDPDLEALRLWHAPLGIYLLLSFLALRLGSLHMVDPLPVNRRLLFALIVLPSFVVFCSGYLAGTAIASRARTRRPMVELIESRGGNYQVVVPFSAWRLAPDGNPPAVESPWGETLTPVARFPAVLWTRAALYNPFSVGPQSSRRFVAFQLSRAIDALYGTSISPGAVEERYLDTDSGGRVVPKAPVGNLLRDHPEFVARSAAPAAVILVPLVVVPWLLLATILLRAYRPLVPKWRLPAIYFGAMGAMLVFMLGLSAAMIAGSLRPPVAAFLLEVAARWLADSRASLAASWIVCVAVLAAVYRLAESAFLRMEIPTTPARYTLFERRAGGS
jgi:hypothetical protein